MSESVSFSNPHQPQLSRDASYLLSCAGASRDHIFISAGGFGISLLAGLKAFTLNVGVAPVVSSAILMSMVAYAGVRSFHSARSIDKKLATAIASFSDPVPAYKTLMPMTEVRCVVRQIDKIAPDLMSTIADRRERAWDKVASQEDAASHRAPKSIDHR